MTQQERPTTQETARTEDPRDSRGHTVLAEKVIEKIASQVARDESAAGGSSGGFLGLGAHADLTVRPKAIVELTGNLATLSIEVALPYPTPLRQGTQILRERIKAKVSELTGVQVRQVDIKVSWLIGAKDTVKRRRLL